MTDHRSIETKLAGVWKRVEWAMDNVPPILLIPFIPVFLVAYAVALMIVPMRYWND